MKEDDAATVVCLFLLASCIIGIAWAEIEGYIRHRRRKRDASRKGIKS